MNRFMSGVLKMPFVWQVWIFILVLVNGVGPLFFLSESVALVTLSAMIVGGITGEVLTRVQGFTKLLGLMHVSWVPMLVLQIWVLLIENPTGMFAFWLFISALVTITSLIIDIIDVIKYLRGDRKDLLGINL